MKKPYSVAFLGSDPKSKPRQIIVLGADSVQVASAAEVLKNPGERVVIQEGTEPTYLCTDWGDVEQCYAGHQPEPVPTLTPAPEPMPFPTKNVAAAQVYEAAGQPQST